jgi:hypothetical protein
MEEKDSKHSKLVAVIITLGTIIVGLSSYIFYTTQIAKDSTKQRCEYNGWAYADGESFPASDGCNTCICSNGEVACTEMACEDEDTGVCLPDEDCL